MIERERLEELIEQGITVCNAYKDWDNNWHCRYGKVVQEENSLLFKENGSSLSVIMHNTCNLYETKEQAEWEWEFGCIERTERLELPTWEEFEKNPKFNFWVNKLDGLGGLYCIEKTTDIMFDKDGNEYEKEYLDIYATLIENHKTGSGYFYRRDYTKDHYIGACEYARNLFLGKENENESRN